MKISNYTTENNSIFPIVISETDFDLIPLPTQWHYITELYTYDVLVEVLDKDSQLVQEYDMDYQSLPIECLDEILKIIEGVIEQTQVEDEKTFKRISN